MNAVSCTYNLAITGCLFVLATVANGASPVLEHGREATLQTSDGLILFGTIAETNKPSVVLKTPYGRLTVPLDRIVRVNGDRFEAEHGIVREHAVEINAGGDVILEYVIPITRRSRGDTLSLLVPGSVRQVQDIDGKPLPFVAQHTGRHSRCTVTRPEYRLPAVVVRTRLEGAAKVDDKGVRYTYRYTPRSNQTFRLRLTTPAEIETFLATPAAIRASTNTILWEESLERQRTRDFEITYTCQK